MFRRVGLITRKGDAGVRAVLEQVAGLLRARGASVLLDRASAMLLAGQADFEDDAATLPPMDLLVAVGGDGTMLAAGRLLREYPHVRLVGINLGHLGFLTDLTPGMLPDALDRILGGAYDEDERFFLECTVVREGTTLARAQALNDVAVMKWNTARLISVDTWIDGRFVHRQRSDGVIVCTPTGSTAYALSGGGPLLDPALEAIGLVPICPHALTNRPLVVAAGALVEFVVTTGGPDSARVVCDGDDVAALVAGDRVRVRRSGQVLRLLHPAGHDHYATLRAKLHWGREPC